MKWLAGIAITATLIVIPALAYAENAPIDTKADVQKLAGQWMDAYNKKDAATIAKMYTDDAVVSFDRGRLLDVQHFKTPSTRNSLPTQSSLQSRLTNRSGSAT